MPHAPFRPLALLGLCGPLVLLALLVPSGCAFPSEILVPPPPAPAQDTSLACEPVSAGSWAPAWIPPTGASQNLCAAQDLASLYAACFGPEATGDACSSTQSASPACAACVLSASTDASWGPLVSFASTTVVNQAGCLALVDPGAVACAQSAEAQTECEHALCDASCPVSDETSYATIWEQCAAEADEGACAGYDSACLDAALAADGGVDVACSGADFATAFMNVAAVFCGP